MNKGRVAQIAALPLFMFSRISSERASSAWAIPGPAFLDNHIMVPAMTAARSVSSWMTSSSFERAYAASPTPNIVAPDSPAFSLESSHAVLWGASTTSSFREGRLMESDLVTNGWQRCFSCGTLEPFFASKDSLESILAVVVTDHLNAQKMK